MKSKKTHSLWLRALWGFLTGLIGSQDSLNSQTTGSTFSSGKRKKNKQSCSFCSFFSDGRRFVFLTPTLLTHAAPERQQRYSEGVNHTLTQCIPSFPLSFCLSFISFLRIGGGGGGGVVGAAGAWENKNSWKKERMEKEEKTERKREEEEEGGQKLKWMAFFLTATSGWRDR